MKEIEDAMMEAKRLLEDILAMMEVTVEVKESIEGNRAEGNMEVKLQVYGDDLGMLIGKGGKILECLSLIVHTAANKSREEKVPVYEDVQDYRKRREEKFVQMAKYAAEIVARTGRPQTLEAMSARERRLIHIAFKEDPQIMTESIGEGMNRRVVIKPR